jgi:hypothetical protein
MKQLTLKSTFPQVFGDLAFQNRWLRTAMILALAVTTVSLAIAAPLMHRRPIIVTLDRCGKLEPLSQAATPGDEAQEAARSYIGYRYTWNSDVLDMNLRHAEAFVAPQSLKAFGKTARELATFVKEKGVAERVYLTQVKVDPTTNRIQITADRFTEIQGLKAATILRMNLTYQNGPRTYENPWGVYVLKEEEDEATR